MGGLTTNVIFFGSLLTLKCILNLFSTYVYILTIIIMLQYNFTRTMAKKRSKIWSFFTESKDDKVKCDLCNSLYSVKGGSTTNLKKHLMKKHRPTYETIIPCSESNATVLEPSTSTSTEPNPKTNETNSKQTNLGAFINRPIALVREKKLMI